MASKRSLLVTTCTRCGQQVPVGTPMCPRCGMPLQAPLPEFAPQPADQNMPEWMRALQGAHQAGPAMPPPGAMPASDLWNAPDGGAGASPPQGSLAAGSLMGEDALPGRLRPAGAAQSPT